MAFVGGNGRDRRPPRGPRYDPTPNCTCGMKADIRVVENRDKSTWGHLYYCCPNFPSTEVYHCKFFMWCNPRNAGVADRASTNEETEEAVSRVTNGQNREQGGMYVPAS